MNYTEKYFEIRNEESPIFDQDLRMYQLDGKNKLYIDAIENGKVIYTDEAKAKQDVYRDMFETIKEGEQITGRMNTTVKCVYEVKE